LTKLPLTFLPIGSPLWVIFEKVIFQNAIGEITLQKYNFIFNVVFDEVIFYEANGTFDEVIKWHFRKCYCRFVKIARGPENFLQKICNPTPLPNSPKLLYVNQRKPT